MDRTCFEDVSFSENSLFRLLRICFFLLATACLLFLSFGERGMGGSLGEGERVVVSGEALISLIRRLEKVLTREPKPKRREKIA